MGADDGKYSKLVGAGQVALGIGLILKGVSALRGSGTGNGVLDGTRRRAQLGDGQTVPGKVTSRVIQNVRFVSVGNIDERVSEIAKLIKKGSTHPQVRETALGILTKKCGDRWCVQEKDYLAEVSALFWSLRDPRSPNAMRYIRDHAYVDQFHGADKLLKLKSGDCDDGTILLGAMLLGTGYPVKMRVLQAKGAPTWSHIYLLAGIPPTGPTRWVPLDWSVETASPGWEAPGARDVALSGRPAGLVEKVKDFDVL